MKQIVKSMFTVGVTTLLLAGVAVGQGDKFKFAKIKVNGSVETNAYGINKYEKVVGTFAHNGG